MSVCVCKQILPTHTPYASSRWIDGLNVKDTTKFLGGNRKISS